MRLDPANENMKYVPAVDISELVKHDQVMTTYRLGPNGALIYCMEFLEANINWLIAKILKLKDHYLIIDCPGQVRRPRTYLDNEMRTNFISVIKLSLK